MNDSELLNRLADANAYRAGTDLPEAIWTRDLALREVERRTGMDIHQTTRGQTTIGDTIQLRPPSRRRQRRRTGPLAVAVAVALAVLVGVGIVGLSRVDEGSDVAVTTTVATFTPGEALAVTEDFFSAYQDGDIQGMIRLIRPDASYHHEGIGLGSFDEYAADFERTLEWKLAEGTVFTSHNCTVIRQESVTEVTLSCDFGQHEYLAMAVGAPVTQFTIQMVVTPNGISSLRLTREGINSVSRSFWLYRDYFLSWIDEHHPDAVDAYLHPEGIVSGPYSPDNLARGPYTEEWTTVEEARQGGFLTRHYADLWAAYLQANGCTWDQEC